MTEKKKKFPHAVNHPFVMEMKPGKYAFCTCGESQKQPFCDGNHGETGMLPTIEVIEETKTIAWCGCKRSEKGSFCDGSHTKYADD
ncbi:Glutamate synthase [NADPH] large chain [hydrothermal vent metagenome]|uniref:Glutamate synthase [NADPH] large chain n=1 Tax=hydrothermal vent metagenome TaxID=652676 RepID=A0A3B1DU86_9ZZZZ